MKAFIILMLLFAASLFAGDRTGYMGEYLSQIDRYGEKIISLAEAIQEENYGWRPAEGVRSISEVFVHIGGANYFFMTFFGHPMPEGGQEIEKTMTNKSEIIEFLKKSFADLKERVNEIPDSELEEEVVFFDNKMSKRQFFSFSLNHAHEHLGQQIAYARMNNVTPPWSMGSEG